MTWQILAWALVGIITGEAYLAFAYNPTYPYRWTLWLTPLLAIGWASYLQWQGEAMGEERQEKEDYGS